MRRSFPVVALVAGLSMVAGLLAPVGAPGPLSLLEFAAIAWAHALVAIDLESSSRSVGALAVAHDLPGWVRARAEKNRRKASPYLWVGLPLFPLVILAQSGGLVGGPWLTGLRAANLAFQVGAFAGEFAILSAQGRLVEDVEAWAGPPESLAETRVTG